MSSQLGAINSINNLIGKLFTQPKGDFVRRKILIFLTYLFLEGWPSKFSCYSYNFGYFCRSSFNYTFLGRSYNV